MKISELRRQTTSEPVPKGTQEIVKKIKGGCLMVDLTEEQMKENELFQQEQLNYVRESQGRIKTLITDHELQNITPDMFEWAWYRADTEFYKLWHPAHVSWEWESGPEEVGGYGAIHIACETIGGHTFAFRNRSDDPAGSPIPSTLSHVLLMSGLAPAPDDTILLQILAEWEAAPYGVHLRGTFMFPAATPDELLEAHRVHAMEEIEGLAEALPDFCKRTGFRSSSSQ